MKLRKFFGADNLSDLIIIHDDFDVSFLNIKIKSKGGHGGHNGIRDIDRHLGINYWRVRIGIGRPSHDAMDIKAWVLSDFGNDEKSGWLPDLLDAITEELNLLCQHDDGGFMSRVAYLAPAPSNQ